MKSLIIAAFGAVALFSSCSVYRSGQTPDDVYYSPNREVVAPAYVEAQSDRNDGRRYENYRQNHGYDNYATMDDRWLMMRVRNRSRWSMFDDYSMGWGYYQPGYNYGYYNPYSYSYYNHFNNYYNWNSFYNPYSPRIIVVNPKLNPAGYTTARNFNLNSYNNNNYTNRRNSVNGKPVYNYNSARPRFSPSVNNSTNNNNRTLGGSFRRVFSNSNSDRGTYSSGQDRPVRTYSPSYTPSNNNSSRSSGSSSSGSSSSSSSSSGGGSGSRPSRR